MKKVYEINGDDFDTLEGFYEQVSKILLPGVYWGKNLDAFNDILSGGFGTPDQGFIIRWKSSARSQEKLGYKETIKYIEAKLNRCHPENHKSVAEDLEAARRGEGDTLFDILVDIIKRHGPLGEYQEDGVELVLL